jgi:hypothetical protein
VDVRQSLLSHTHPGSKCITWCLAGWSHASCRKMTPGQCPGTRDCQVLGQRGKEARSLSFLRILSRDWTAMFPPSLARKLWASLLARVFVEPATNGLRSAPPSHGYLNFLHIHSHKSVRCDFVRELVAEPHPEKAWQARLLSTIETGPFQGHTAEIFLANKATSWDACRRRRNAQLLLMDTWLMDWGWFFTVASPVSARSTSP